jgi:class 3 adenylate cyclase/predicted ATPase
MRFDEILTQILDLLQREGRVSYWALKHRFDLSDEDIEGLKNEIIEAKRLAIDEQGKVLVWTGSIASEREVAADTAKDASTVKYPVPEAERRQLTVLFCDLVDSTKLASQLDPEDLHTVVRAYQATCAEVIQQFEGHIAQYLGDGLLVYFGYPQAHEDDAQRAVRTGLGIVEALERLHTRLAPEQHIRLAVRVGIHTGSVVIGEMGGTGRSEQLALGETPNIAARLQGLAQPDTVVISGETARLVQGFFLMEDLGTHALKGMATPLPVYRVLRASGAQSRLEVIPPRGLTPLVGRESEVALLLDRWEQVKEGMGHVVLLSGEAGIGKSRVVFTLKEQVAAEPHFRWECRCSPYHQHSALYPIIDLFARALLFQQGDTSETKLHKLETTLTHYGISFPDMVPLLASLLSLSLGDHYPPLSLSPQRQKQKTLEAVLTLSLQLAAQQPVLFIMEDLHWVDPSTLEFLHLLVDQGPTVRIFTLLTFRPDFQIPWGTRAHLTSITLNRLPRRQVERMIERVTGGKILPTEVMQQVVTKTDGVPLFVEELTKMILESGLLQERADCYVLTSPLPPLAIPTTLQDSLMARLDRLATVKEVAQLGATLGRTFPYALLQAVSSLDETTLQQALARLVEAELLYQRGLPPQATYIFKHALIQETAYQSLLKSTRQQYHQQIAQVLVDQFPEMVALQPELVAHHYTEAGLSAQAIVFWQRAGDQASERSAHVEAIAHLTRGLELLQTLPDTPERTQQELLLQVSLELAFRITKGYTAPEVSQTYARARELCQQVGETPQLSKVLYGLWIFYLGKAEFQTAHELGEQLFSLAQRYKDSDLILEAHRTLGATLFYLGDLSATRMHTEQGIALYNLQYHRAQALLYGFDPGVMCHSYAAWTLWLLGYPDQALQQSQEAVTLAQELSHPHSLAVAFNFTGVLHLFRREGQVTQRWAEALITLAKTQVFPHWLASGTIHRGGAMVIQGQWEEGINQIQNGLTNWRALGIELSRASVLIWLAGAYGKAEKIEEGLRSLDEAAALVEKTGERFLEAEFYRLKGELLLQQSTAVGALLAAPMVGRASLAPTEEAETCFHHALDIARRQQAKSLELRAAMSLSRLWQQQGKRAEAHELLAEIYGWFTEGFDTADLQEAKALLEELS